MKILLVTTPTDYNAQIYRALIDLGHEVHMVDDRLDYALPQSLRGNAFLWRLSRRIGPWRKRSNERLQEVLLSQGMSGRYDVMLSTKGMLVKKETLEALLGRGIKTVSWFPDNAANEPYASWVRRVGPLWHAFFSFDSAIYRQMPEDSHERVHVLPFAVEPEVYRQNLTARDRERFSCDVAFVGAPYPERIGLLRALGERVRVKVWGWSGWKNTPLRSQWNGPLNAVDSAKAYGSAKIVLNTNVRPLAGGVNIKTFEICAAGGFQLTDEPSDLRRSFEPGRELATFSDVADFRGKVDYWLRHDAERAAIARAGRARVERDHRMSHRVSELLRIVMKQP